MARLHQITQLVRLLWIDLRLYYYHYYYRHYYYYYCHYYCHYYYHYYYYYYYEDHFSHPRVVGAESVCG